MTNKYEYEQDEPFGWYDGIGFSTNKNDFGKAISTATPLYTHPAPAWQGLSKDEINQEALKDDGAAYFALGAEWANNKLKEKNT